MSRYSWDAGVGVGDQGVAVYAVGAVGVCGVAQGVGRGVL